MQHQPIRTNHHVPCWCIRVPQQQNFTEPQFHFGQHVYWPARTTESLRDSELGQIIGMQFVSSHLGWHYQILKTQTTGQPKTGETIWVVEHKLIASPTYCSSRTYPDSASKWLTTAAAAAQLDISARQLRKLRSKGLFRVGYHYRDMSVPGSGLPRWQWHIDRCEKALSIPPTKRSNR